MVVLPLLIAAAAGAADAPTPASAEASGGPVHQICRRIPNGTRLGFRFVCLTEPEWERVARHWQDGLARNRDRVVNIRPRALN